MANYKVTATSLNIRSKPSLQGAIIGILRGGQVVREGEITKDQTAPPDPQRQWMNIEVVGGSSGWSSLRYLKETIEKPDAEKYRVTASSLHVRSGPSVEADVIGFLKKDQIVPGGEKSADERWMRIKLDSGLEGWSSLKYLMIEPIPDGDEPIWLTIARGEMGIKEWKPGDNPRIVEYHKSTNLHQDYAEKDETHWCSSFVNWCLEKAGYEGTDSAWARSWNNWGRKLSHPQVGCIAVFKRGSNSGHVGFYLGETGSTIRLLGGNQSDAVSIINHPKSKLLSYRWTD